MIKTIPLYLGLGGNLGNRLDFLSQACRALEAVPLREFRISSVYQSEPLAGMKQPKYLNLVVCGFTELSAQNLLEKCRKIEDHLGRIRKERWGARTIDIDILSYGKQIIDTETLKIPHPELEKRSFVLLPLLELSPEWVHPETGIGIRTLWEQWQKSHDEPNPQCLPKKLNPIVRKPAE